MTNLNINDVFYETDTDTLIRILDLKDDKVVYAIENANENTIYTDYRCYLLKEINRYGFQKYAE